MLHLFVLLKVICFLLVSIQRKGNLFLIKEEAFHVNLIQFWIKKTMLG
jgi:hypothetical protein